MASQQYAPVVSRTTASGEADYTYSDNDENDSFDYEFEDDGIELSPISALSANNLGATVGVQQGHHRRRRIELKSVLAAMLLPLVIIASMPNNNNKEGTPLSSSAAPPTSSPTKPPSIVVMDSTHDDLQILRNYFPLNLLSLRSTQIWIDGDVSFGHPRPVMGQIPTQIGLLTKLTYLELEDHPSIAGTIPSQVGLLTQMQSFILSHNQNLTGNIPSDLGYLSSSLLGIILSRNALTGTLPMYQPHHGNDSSGGGGGIATLTNLASLDVRANRLTGTIPFLPSNDDGAGQQHSLITSLSYLEWLELSDNLFEPGTIPTEIGLMTRLTFLGLGACQLSGTIPTDLGLLTRLTWLHLPSNNLSAPLPTELGQLTQLTDLDVRNNTPLLSATT